MIALIASFALIGPGSQVELRKLDASTWPHVFDRQGSTSNATIIRRDSQKNRPYTSQPSKVDWSFSHFVDTVQVYDQGLQLTGKTAGGIEENEKLMLFVEKFENHMVSVTGYAVLAYAGGAQTANYDSTTYHDWYLEIYQKPVKVPKIGGPTPIICDITRFTERQLYDKGIRLQPLIAEWKEMKNGKAVYHSTGHPAHKVRVTGYLYWEGDHNKPGSDIGPKVKSIDPSGGLHPWRQTAWEVHPITNIEDLGR